MKARFVRVGNSQALMIPATVMRDRGWSIGDKVDLQQVASGMVVTDPSRRLSIAKIVDSIVEENIELIRALAKV